MKAAVNRKYGEPDVIEVTDVPSPAPSARQILIKVHASTVNRTDDGFLRAKPFVTRFFSGLIKPRRQILGCSFAGEVIELGEGCHLFDVGDRVFGFDDIGWGGHGEMMVINEQKAVAKIPKNISYEQAAASTEGGHYALSYARVIRKLGAKKVLVHGASGAIGSAAVQLLKHDGMQVVATGPTKHINQLKKLGANRLIDWQKTDFTKDKQRYDIVFDSVGKSRFRDCKALLEPRGVYIATELGPYGQNPLLALLSLFYKLFGRKRVLFPLPRNTKAMMEFLAERLADNSLTPIIERSYSLSEIADAYRYVESGEKLGNVIIVVQR